MKARPHSDASRNVEGKRDLSDLKIYLDGHFREKIVLEDLATGFFINKFYLTRVFKEQFGVTVGEYLLKRRMELSKELLKTTDSSIGDVGMLCGFEDANYFARAFKKCEGMSPTQYRRKK